MSRPPHRARRSARSTRRILLLAVVLATGCQQADDDTHATARGELSSVQASFAPSPPPTVSQDVGALPPGDPARPDGTAPAAPTGGRILDLALAIARADHPRLDEAAVRAEIARLASAYRERLARTTTPTERADALAELLFVDEGFVSVDELDSAETLHVDSVLAARRGYCLSLSVVALAVAEAVGEPLHGVALPNHFLVRWDDGTTRRNLELTRRGAPLEDAAYLERMGDFFTEGSLYLRNLTPDEVRAVLLHNRGFVALSKGRRSSARADLEAAARALPALPEVHRNLGVLHGEAGDWPAAITAFERALVLYPGDVDALVNLALARHAGGDVSAALEDARMALLLDPSRQRARSLIAEWGPEAALLAGGGHPLDRPPSGLAPGLLGHYYAGKRFDRLVATRVDRELDFDWQRGRPMRGVPSDEFSVRWEGWFQAPVSGVYTLFVIANDGVRFTFGDTVALEHWRDVGYTSWTGAGDVELSAGWHPLRIDYYDDDTNARLWCQIGLEGRQYPIEQLDHLFHVRE